MLGVVVSRADAASVHIGEHLRELVDWTTRSDPDRPDAAGGGSYYRTAGAELRTFDGLHIELDAVAEAFSSPRVLVFASRHAGETGPLLTAHHPGNFGPADFGGEPGQLASAAPAALATAVTTLDTHAPDGYDVGLECTHHGPTDPTVPSLFVEVGSDDPQWRDPAAAAAAARGILSLRGVDPATDRAFVGFGGGHYAPRFARIVRETDWAVGHIAADWALAAVDGPHAPSIAQAFDRSGARLAVVDGDRPALCAHIEALGHRVVGESWLRETSGVPLGLVDHLETTLGPVDEGLRFGRAARTRVDPASLHTVEPSADLLADANGVSPDRVRSAIAVEAVAYETVEAGSRAAGRIVVPDAAAAGHIESALVSLLRERFDEVRVDVEEIVARERAFDPERARELGVSPGPAFGALAAGEPVTVDGREIAPDAVHVTRSRRYPRFRA